MNRAGDNAVQDRILTKMVAGWRDDPCISDLFAAVTNNKIEGRWTHPASYFAESGAREVEAFANLFEIRCRTTPGLWAKIRQDLPSLAECMASIVK